LIRVPARAYHGSIIWASQLQDTQSRDIWTLQSTTRMIYAINTSLPPSRSKLAVPSDLVVHHTKQLRMTVCHILHSDHSGTASVAANGGRVCSTGPPDDPQTVGMYTRSRRKTKTFFPPPHVTGSLPVVLLVFKIQYHPSIPIMQHLFTCRFRFPAGRQEMSPLPLASISTQ
jgi:hypothetical protein